MGDVLRDIADGTRERFFERERFSSQKKRS
jgi:hypothetical protein